MKLISKINILIVGSGGREHALCNKILKSKWCNKLFAIPGNSLWKNVDSFPQINPFNNAALILFAKEKQIDLTIVGPEDILENAISDEFAKNNLLIFAPNKKAALIETSKNFSKKLMNKYNIPTAKYKAFNSFNESKKHIELNIKYPIVIKSSNLAAGKGVVICNNKLNAINYLNEIFVMNKYGKNNSVVIEEFMVGQEFSLMCLVNNDKIYPLPVCQDHKPVYDNNKGLNTGGMGVISDPSFLTENDINTAIKDCIEPLVMGMIKEKINYIGVLFAGIMKTDDNQFKVIEYNARWGDPETEVILQKINCDIIEFLFAVLNKEKYTYTTIKEKISSVVVCAKNYPLKYQKNIDVSFIKNESNIFYMGMKAQNDKLLSTSGRIFILWNKDLNNPSDKIYKRLKELIKNNSDFHYRKDIK